MKRWTRAAAAAAALLIRLPVPARAITPEDQKIVERGFDALYRSDYDGSEKIFGEALKERPGDPVLSLGCAVAAWWRMENDFAPAGSPQEKRFLDAVKLAIEDAKRAASKGDDAEAHVCLGAAYGLRGRLEAARKHWFKAYRDGGKCYREEQRAVKLDPKQFDAYLGLGAFDYYSATLSRFVRLFVFTGGGDKAKGLAELKLATNGQFGGQAAKLLLVGVNWTFEKNPAEAWKILGEVTARYPDSPLLDSMRLIGLFHLRDAEGLVREARAFLKKAEDGAPFYRPIDKAAGHYFLGLGEQLAGRYEEALAQDRAALALLPAKHPTSGLPRLLIGESLDLLGRREEAEASYRQTLKDPPFWGVQRWAKVLLKRPFRPGDNPLPGRSDELD
jgi:tetratricopeptide (TPR) repeat protein